MTSSEDIELNPSELGIFYLKYFKYYNTLAPAYKDLFIERCLKFISEKEINGTDDFKLDNRVKAMVAASAVQLTLGLEVWQLNYFDKIEIHPSNFDNATGDLKFSGETNLQGYIKLSWKSFIHGYSINDDNINLGLHEFSHALRFNNIRGHQQDYFIDHYLNKWMACAYPAFNDVKNNRESIFRKYGGTNINEFLSVCIEHYFESPDEIKKTYPLLYYATGILLNQCLLNGQTKIGVRQQFMQEQNKLLPGFTFQTLKSNFLHHWSFKLWIFVFAILVYNSSTSGLFTAMSFGLFAIFISIYVWYDYNAAKIEFDKTAIHFEKGSFLFKKRKAWSVAIAQLISIKVDSEDWSFTYYKMEDNFFYEEKITYPKKSQDLLLKECGQNKVALLNKKA